MTDRSPDPVPPTAPHARNRPGPDDPRRLSRCARELAALVAPPAAPGNSDLGGFADRLAGALRRALPLEWLYVRLGDTAEGTTQEFARTGQGEGIDGRTLDLGRALEPWARADGSGPVPVIPDPIGPGTVRLAVAAIDPEGGGTIVVASRRADFPTDAERLLLEVAAGQTAAALRRRRAEAERKRADEALYRSELHFRRALEKLPAGAYTCDPDGLITYFNPHAVRLWGRAPKLNDPVDRFCGSFRLFAADGAPITHDRCWMALALQTGNDYCGQEIVIERPDGTRLTTLAYASPIRDGTGQLLGAVNVLVDITGQKRAEEALREADRRKDEFLAVLAHELRNPLAPIRNALHVMRLSGTAGPAAERARQMMERQVGHLIRLVDDLLEVSRITRGKIGLRRERVELAAVVRSAVETSSPLIEAAGHRLSVELSPAPVVLDADPVRLAQVIANLLNNAAKYTDEGGRIVLTARREGGAAVVSVRDTGAGIPADMLPRVFDPFTQEDRTAGRARGGLGVGLALARHLVELHGGTIAAHSDGPGRGSTFTVRLPLVAAAPGDGRLRGGARAAGAAGTEGGATDRPDRAGAVGGPPPLPGRPLRPPPEQAG